MKPVRLVVEGFGTYLNKQEIDFEKLTQPITLLTGNTGAGKTTIFDAICCALYGETSGRERSFSQMRSKKADAKTKTSVEFTFRLKGEEYTVKRSPTYERAKQKGEGTTTKTGEAVLYRPDGKIITKTQSVTEEITKILGIGKDEFRQIVMIAQNDFMAMIKETNKNQERIFNKIFNASLFDNFTKKITEGKKKAESDLQKKRIAIMTTLDPLKGNLVDLRTQLDYTDLDIPKIKELLEESLESEKDQLKNIQEIKGQEEKKLKSLEERERDEKETVTLFDDLKKQRNEEKKLLDQNLLIEENKKKLEQNSYAREYLLPDYKKLKEEKEKFNSKKADYIKLDSALKEDKTSLKKVEEDLSGYSTKELLEKEQKLERLNKEKESIVKVRSQEAQLFKFTQELQDKEQTIKTKGKLQEGLEKKDQELIPIDPAMITAEEKLIGEQDKRVRDETRELKKIEEAVNKGQVLLKNYAQSLTEQKVLLDKATERDRTYQRYYNLFLASQSAILAERLQDNEPCPVCGSLEHPKKADYPSEKVTSEELEELEKLKNGAEKKLKKEREYSQSLSDTIKGMLYLCESSPYLNCNKVEDRDSSAESYQERIDEILEALRAAKTDLSSQKENYQESIKKLEALKNKAVEIVSQKEKIAVELTNIKKEIESAESDKNSLDHHIVQLQSSLEFLKKDLTQEDLTVLEEKIVSEEKDIKVYRKTFEDLKEQKEKIAQEVNTKSGQLFMLKDELTGLKETLDKVRADFENDLEKSPFDSEKAFGQALLDSKVVKRLEEVIKTHEQKLLITEKEIERLEKSLEQKEIPDLKKTSEELSSQQQVLQKIDSELRDKHIWMSKLETATECMRKDGREYLKLKDLFDTYFGLDSVINKKGSTFTQFVISIYIKRVLEKANIKLDQMTSGTYRLEQVTEGKLDLLIYDSNAGERREIKTLSGGETFIVSLALALGFSETVEELNGGIRLDTIFIDEGFGALDPEYLDRAMDALDTLTSGRQVMIVSHVEGLKERIPQQIQVNNKAGVSSIQLRTV